jgi:serine protease Do
MKNLLRPAMLVLVAVATSVIINAHYRSIQEVIHSGIGWTWSKNQTIGEALYAANDMIFNGAGFDSERRIKDTIFSSYPSVVMISVYPNEQGMKNPLLPRLSGRGTGFFVEVSDTEALVMTNHHVIDAALEHKGMMALTINTATEMWTYDGEIVGTDPIADIAIVRIKKQDNEQWKALNFADPSAISEGDPVVVIGHGMSLPWTNTAGIITYDGRFGQRPYSLMLQTDAVINQGNSGGPVIGMKGNVYGIAQSILSPGRNIPGWDGIGLAVHSKQAKRSFDYIMSPAYASKGYVPYSDKLIETKNFEFKDVEDIAKRDRHMAYVSYPEAVEGVERIVTPGEKAGLLQGDIILELDGKKVYSSWQLMVHLVYAIPGDTVQVRIKRGERELIYNVTYTEADMEKITAELNKRRGGK